MMKQNRLKIVNVPQKRHVRRLKAQTKYEQLWEHDPEKFNPLRNCTERERIERSWDLLREFMDPKNLLCADLGCGSGVFSRKLHNAGATVHAVDIANSALKYLPENIKAVQDNLPATTLDDDTYDFVICLDVIAHLQPDEFRLLFSELSRLIKRDGTVLCSTPIDINAEDSLSRFTALVQTEFKISKWVFSNHRLHIRLCNFFESPILQYISKPLSYILRQNRWLMLITEKICRFFWSDSGISHAIFIGKRRPLIETTKETPKLKLGKKQVWE